MKSAITILKDAKAELPLPTIALTRSGVTFAPETSQWAFRDGCDNVRINFSLIPESCGFLVFGLKRTLIWYFANRSARTTRTIYDSVLSFARYLALEKVQQVREITAKEILNFKTSSPANAYALGTIRGFLLKWIQLGAPGVDCSVKDCLASLKLDQRQKGVAVATLDSKKGPFTDLEFESIQFALNSHFAIGTLTLGQLMLCYLFMALGARPAQLASLKCGDLNSGSADDGDYFLRVPRAKQKGQLGRTEFKFRRLAGHIGAPLAVYAKSIEQEFRDRVTETSEVPLFPQRRDPVYPYPSGFEFHQTPPGLAGKIGKLFDALNVPSERLDGAPVPVTPVRFRRTFATRAAEEGWPMLVLAELMDHSNTRSVAVYAGLTSRVRATFSRQIAAEMAPLANAFMGKIIGGENEATRADPSSRIVDLRVDQQGAPMGSCGTYLHCGFARPLACYGGCHEFEPWLDGPHEEALQYMLDRRAKLAVEADARIAAINDRAILGCAQVIARCEEIKAGRNISNE